MKTWGVVLLPAPRDRAKGERTYLLGVYWNADAEPLRPYQAGFRSCTWKTRREAREWIRAKLAASNFFAGRFRVVRLTVTAAFTV